MTGDRLAQAAQSLVGAPFRLHGRDPALGLDCVGLVHAAFAAAGLPVDAPRTYALRNTRIDDALAFAGRAGLVDAEGPVAPGDILLVRPGPAQFHLLVAVHTARFVHAHAGLRRVVATPGPLPWPISRHWRFEGHS